MIILINPHSENLCAGHIWKNMWGFWVLRVSWRTWSQSQTQAISWAVSCCWRRSKVGQTLHICTATLGHIRVNQVFLFPTIITTNFVWFFGPWAWHFSDRLPLLCTDIGHMLWLVQGRWPGVISNYSCHCLPLYDVHQMSFRRRKTSQYHTVSHLQCPHEYHWQDL